MARESGMLGQYDASISQYKTALDHIELGLDWGNMSTSLDVKWKQLIQTLKAEHKQVKAMKEELLMFTHKPKVPAF
jgi:uncharacterized protein YqgV (UPF0045/DUF77 family)